MQWLSPETSTNLNGTMNETRSWTPADGKSAPAISCDAAQVFKAEAVVIHFLVDHIQRKNNTGLVSELPPAINQALVAAGLKARVGPLKLSTVVQRVAVLSTAHKLKRMANPCELPSVRMLLSRARRAAVKRGERPAKKTAVARAELEAMLATCDDSLEGLCDRALLCFGFASGGRRRSEIAAADWRRRGSMKGRFSGGSGRGGSALPCSPGQWHRSSSVALSWRGWKETSVHIA